MSLTFGLALYFIIWWTVLFAVLPLRVRTQGEDGVVVPGTPASAPTTPRLAWVAAVTTIVAAVVFAVVWAALAYRWIDLDVLVPGPARPPGG